MVSHQDVMVNVPVEVVARSNIANSGMVSPGPKDNGSGIIE